MRGTDDVRALLTLLDNPEVLTLSGYDDPDVDALRRAVANLDFTEGALLGDGTLLSEVSDPVDLEQGDSIRVTVTVDADKKADLYTLLADKEWVRDVADAHARRPPA